MAVCKIMFHTESYIDHESVDSSLHMVSLAGKMEGRDTLIWAVWKDRELLTQYQERLREWFLNELGTVLGQGETNVMKELMRISLSLQCRLYLYYGQKLYRSGERVEEGEICLESPFGAYVHREGKPVELSLETELEQMKSKLGESSSFVSENASGKLQKLGNIWQQNIMDCIVKDSLSYAYFMLWEAR